MAKIGKTIVLSNDIVTLPASSVLKSANITEAEFSTSRPYILKLKINYTIQKGIAKLLNANMISTTYKADVTSLAFLYDDYDTEHIYRLKPDIQSYTFDIKNPSTINLSINLEDSEIPLDGLPNNISSLNVHFIFNDEGNSFELISSIVNDKNGSWNYYEGSITELD